jgi:predicted hydrocarbon binding protein
LAFSDLKPHADLRRKFEEGLILEGAQRILSFRVQTFQALVDRLLEVTGRSKGRVLLTQIGNEIGHAAMGYSRDRIRTQNDLAPILDNILKHRGWGKCLSIEETTESDKSIFTATMENCPLCFERKPTHAACDIMKGIVSAWIEAYLGRKAADATETKCAGLGEAHCVFQVTFQH